MSKMSKVTAKASRRFKDVPVVLDRELAQEREALVSAVMRESALSDERLSYVPKDSAQAALDEWDAEHADSVLVVRVRGCLGGEWPAIRAKNPAQKGERDTINATFGFDVVAATVDALTQFAQIMDGDTAEDPTEEEWTEFFQAVNPADMTVLTQTVVQLNGTPTSQVFGDLVKA